MALAIAVILLAAIGALWARNQPSRTRIRAERDAQPEQASVA